MDSFEWNGETYTESGVYTYNTTNASGCDSTATLNLTINNSSSSSVTEVACDSFEWNGETYTESGVYTYSTINASGCDSTATLNLTINNSSTSSSDVSACDSYFWNGEIYIESGVYTYNTTNASGCDSTATLNLTINSVQASEIVVSNISAFGASIIDWVSDDASYYDISVSSDNYSFESLSFSDTSITLDDLNEGEDYSVTIISYDENGCTASSNVSFSSLLTCNVPQNISFDFTPSTALLIGILKILTEIYITLLTILLDLC